MSSIVENEKRVLSIQSWVVHGYVGNKCSSFALQSLGFDVDLINTVQFSNHTGYPTFRGTVTTAEQLWDIWQGLIESQLANYSCVLSGYCRDVNSMKNIEKIVDSLRLKQKDFIYACDPVMADDGIAYVPNEVIQEYKTTLIPKADIIFPNMTELELLTDMKIKCFQDAFDSIDVLHKKGVTTVIVKSLVFEERDDYITIVVSTFDPLTHHPLRHKLSVSIVPGDYSGTGDLFAAITVGWMLKGLTPFNACENAVCCIESILLKTVSVGTKEIRLIQSREDFRHYSPKEGDCRKAIVCENPRKD